MGVEGLLSIVKQYREVFTYGVVNKDLNDDFDYKYFLFDGSSWLWNTMRGNILMDFGYIRRRAKTMVEKFRMCGFKLIVFIDANISNNKLDTWLYRRAERVETVYAINHKIKSNKGNIQGFKHIWFAPCGAYFFCGQIFQSLGCKVIYAHIDCDREMYGYYLMNKPYETITGIIGFDTDFLIFNFPLYLEFTSMRFNKQCNILCFDGYQHYKLLNRLRCKQRHLPRVASVMGCDVTNRLQTCSGNIDYAVKIVKETELALKNKQENKNKNKNKNHQQYFGENHGGLKRRFSSGDIFYSGICPLDILKHPYLIMLLFQDYNCRIDKCMLRSDKQNKMNKNGSPFYDFKGVILDMCMDDVELIKNNKEASSIVTLKLRKWLYRYILTGLRTDVDDKFNKMINKKELRMRELICYSASRLCFKSDMAKREWLKGVSVKVFDECKMNPLLNLQSYKFVNSMIKMNEIKDEVLCVEIPAEYMVKDIIYLLTYLKDLDQNENKIDEHKMEDDDVKDVADADAVKETNVNHVPFVFGVVDNTEKDSLEILETNNIEIKNDSDKNECKNKIKKKTKKRGKRGRGGKKKNKNKKQNEDENNINGKMNEKNMKKKKKKKKGLKVWDGFTVFMNAFMYQWKYRDIFIDLNNGNDKKDGNCGLIKNKHNEFASHALKIHNRSMHYRSMLFSVYELIYVFLQIEFECKWFSKYYCEFLRYHYNENRRQNDKNKNKNKDNFCNVPKLRLLNGIDCELQRDYNEDCQCVNCKIKTRIDSWKDKVIYNNDNDKEIEIDLQIPYIWDILNTRIFHWIWAHQAKTKKWIKECRPNEL